MEARLGMELSEQAPEELRRNKDKFKHKINELNGILCYSENENYKMTMKLVLMCCCTCMSQ